MSVDFNKYIKKRRLKFLKEEKVGIETYFEIDIRS
jgi:hypothetical protein